MSQKLIRYILLLSVILAMASACGNSDSHRQSQRDQNEADSNAEMNDLAPAEADYTGTMHMIKSSQDFQIHLFLKRTYSNIPTAQPADSTIPINVPELSGNLEFPVLDRINDYDYSQYSELLEPLGGYKKIVFEHGDYDPKTNILILPYDVSGYSSGSFGEIQGKLINGVFTGTWFAKPLGVVGTFVLTQTQSSTVNQ